MARGCTAGNDAMGTVARGSGSGGVENGMVCESCIAPSGCRRMRSEEKEWS